MTFDTITLKQLKLLDAIVRHNSYTQAGKEMYLSQPAVSLQIKSLEAHFEEALLEKSNKQIHLTQTGKIVLETAHAIQHQMEQMAAQIAYMKGKVAGPLDIAVVTSAKYFLPGYLGEFLQLYPHVTPRLTVTNRATILEALTENRHNLYIMGQVPQRLKVEARPFLENILEVVASPRHPLCDKENISLAELAEERFLVREKGSGTLRATIDLFAQQNLSIHPYMELGDTGAIKNAVMADIGIAVLSHHATKLERRSARMSVLKAKDFPLHRHWYAIYPGEKTLSIVTRTFLDFLMSKRQTT